MCNSRNTCEKVGHVNYLKYLLVGSFILVVVLPIALLVIQSFAFRWSWGSVLPTAFSLRGWQVLLQEPKVLSAVCITVLVGTIVIAINLLIAIPAGRAMAFNDFKGKTIVDVILFMPILVPALAVAMGIHLTMIRLGLANTVWGVVLVHCIPTVPYAIRILRTGYERMGQRWLEQARTLGASSWKCFLTVTLPMLLPSIRTTIFLVFLISLSQYALTAIVSGGSVITLAMIYYPFLQTVDNAVIASFSLLFALIPILFLAVIELFFRYAIPYQRSFSYREEAVQEGGKGHVC
ncbi:ABC transporter permease [Desulfuribacillus alkaliarsenatis]|uniref:ABC transporter permease n=1 Tax=Desulfuribacillus alkaliarsenatis TaxID=766136 RepID=A0A1E5G337_9FIRM|nr:ABC transporter permease subunit [Desulfuribacillus alkaliarsenatis]OEF97478.1 ABC transporter permease [Desulfuribacillus alkaliarsenatis]